MKQEDIIAALEAVKKSGITVNGDLVLEKKVEYEVANVENGGIGIQINHEGQGSVQQTETKPKKEVSADELAQAIENCQQHFWANSAYAVLYCLLRDELKKEMSQSGFERMVEMLPYKKTRSYQCPTGTIANAFSDNTFLRTNISEWETSGAPQRAVLLLQKLREELKL